MERDGANKSLWQVTEAYMPANKPKVDQEFDVIIIGAGITGLTTALQLQLAGKKCLVLKSHTIGVGTTGRTTAHLNTFFDTPYSAVISDFGKENAQLLANAAAESLALIQNNIRNIVSNATIGNGVGSFFLKTRSKTKSSTK